MVKPIEFILIGGTTLLMECANILVQRGHKIKAISSDDNKIKYWANRNRITYISKLKTIAAQKINADYLISIVNPHILDKNTLKQARKLAINYHDSLLPKYKGINATSWALINKETNHGISWHLIDQNIDAGDIVLQRKFPINHDDDVQSLNLKCYQHAVESFSELIEKIETNNLNPQKQTNCLARPYKLCDKPKNNGFIDWNQSALEIKQQFSPLKFGKNDNTLVLPKFIINNVLYSFSDLDITNEKSLKLPGHIIQQDSNNILVTSADFNILIKNYFSLHFEKQLKGKYLTHIPTENKYSTGCTEKYHLKTLREASPCVPTQFLETIRHSPKKITFDIKKGFKENLITALFTYLFRSLALKNLTIGYKLPDINNSTVKTHSDFIPLNIKITKKTSFKSLLTEVTQKTKLLTPLSIELLFRYKEFLNQIDYWRDGKNVVLFTINQAYDQLNFENSDLYKPSLYVELNTKLNYVTIGSYADSPFSLYYLDIMKKHIQHYLHLIDFEPLIKIHQLSYHAPEESQLYEGLNRLDGKKIREKNLYSIFKKKSLEITEASFYEKNNPPLTYKNVEELSSNLSRHLLALKHATTTVGIYTNLSQNFIIAMLACMKANIIMVPISRTLPTSRVQDMVKNVGLKCVLTDSDITFEYKKLRFIDIRKASIQNPSATSNIYAQNQEIAYIMHTSGSTGIPKGAACTHKNVINLLAHFESNLKLSQKDNCLAITDIGFDVSIYELWSAIYAGANLYLSNISEIKSGKILYQFCKEHKINSLYIPPFFIKDFIIAAQLDKKRPPIKRILVGVEPILTSLLKKCQELFPKSIIINGYGPTEATVCVTTFLFDKEKCLTKYVPIGKPVQNNLATLKNSQNMTPLVGSIGNLNVEGSNIGKGYWKNAKLTKQYFYQNQNWSGYRTGDLVKILPDGNLLFVGRKDHQIKRHGVRIEIGDINANLLVHPNIEKCYTYFDKKLKKIFIFYKTKSNSDLDHQSILQFLSNRLPTTALPDILHQVDEIPQNSNGKTNRKSLLEHYRNRPIKKLRKRLKTKDPKKLAIYSAFEKLLTDKNLNNDSDFFLLGGDSLKALKLIILLEKEGYFLTLQDIYRHRTAIELSKIIKKIPIKSNLIVKNSQQIPMTECQKMIYLAEFNNQENIYNIPLSFYLPQNINAFKLQDSLKKIINKSDIFNFEISENFHFIKKQIDPSISIETVESTELAEYLENLAKNSVSLKKNVLWHIEIIETEKNKLLFINLHHILADAWSIKLFLESISSEYADKKLTLNSFSSYISKLKNSKVKIRNKSGKEPTSLVDNLNTKSPKVIVQSFPVSIKLFEKIKENSKLFNCSIDIFLTLVFFITLNRITSEKNITIGIINHGRYEAFDLRVLGPTLRCIPLSLSFDENKPISFVLSQLIKNLNVIHSTQNVICVKKKSVEDYNILLNISLTENTPILAFKNHHCETVDIDYRPYKLPLIFNILKNNNEYKIQIEFSDNHSSCVIQKLKKEFINTLINLNQPNTLLVGVDKELNLKEAIRPFLDKLPDRHLAKQNIVSRFEIISKRFPNNIAVVSDQNKYSYKKLHHDSSLLASWLVDDNNFNEKEKIGLYIHRGYFLVVGVLGILKAGLVYVPLDYNSPLKRNKLIIENTGLKLILTDNIFKKKLGRLKNPCIDINEVLSENARRKISKIEKIDINQLAYIIHTSGSTGLPKGVQITHNHLAWLFETTEKLFNFSHEDIWTFYHSYAFDFSIWEILGALLYGGQLIVVDDDTIKNPMAFSALVTKHKVSILSQTPTAFQILTTFNQSLNNLKKNSLRYIVFGGEKLIPTHLKRWLEISDFQKPQLINMYGLTESTVHTTFNIISPQELKLSSIPLGKSLEHLGLLLIDKNLQPIYSPGIIGEIAVAGYSIANGYINRDIETQKKFISIDNKGIKIRIYLTGDLGKYDDQFRLFHMGRKDNQVKIRGYRIELSDIETTIVTHPNITHAAIVVKNTSISTNLLIAYIVIKPNTSVNPDQIRKYLKKRLPPYMIPHQFKVITSIPINKNGKLDKNKLLILKSTLLSEKTKNNQKTTDTIEKKMCKTWASVLNIYNVCPKDNYFKLGGDSIQSLIIITELKKQGINLSLEDLYKYQSIENILKHQGTQLVTKSPYKEYSLISKVDKNKLPNKVIDAYPMSKLQLGMVFHSHLSNFLSYQDIFSIKISAPLHQKKLKSAIEIIINENSILRTGFEIIGYSEPLQLVYRHSLLQISSVNLVDYDQNQQKQIIQAWFVKEKKQPLNISEPPLIRFQTHLLNKSSFQLGFTCHHAILDGWSAATMITKILKYYDLLLQSKGPKSNSIPSYAIYVKNEKKYLEEEYLATFWKKYLSDFNSHNLKNIANVSTSDPIRLDYTLDKKMVGKIKKFSKKHSLPTDSIMFSLHCATLLKIAKNGLLRTGFVTHNRPEEQNSHETLGLFLNVLPFVLEPFDSINWLTYIDYIHKKRLELLEHKYLPYSHICKLEKKASLVDILFNFINFHVYESIKTNKTVKLEDFDGYERTDFPLVVEINLTGISTLLLRLTYSSKDFTSLTENYLDNFLFLLKQFVEGKKTKIKFTPQTLASISKTVSKTKKYHFAKELSATFKSSQNISLIKTIKIIWSKYLDIPIKKISLEDNLFELGGDSIISLQIVNDLQKSGINIYLEELLNQKSLLELINFIKTKTIIGNQKNLNTQPLPLFYEATDTQNLMLKHYNFEKTKSYHVQQGYVFVDQTMNFEKLVKTSKKHFTEKITYKRNFTKKNGKIYQYISKDPSLKLRVLDLTTRTTQCQNKFIHFLHKTTICREINILKNSLWFIYILKLSPLKAYLFIDTHHAVIDGWSEGILLNELLDEYSNPSTKNNIVCFDDMANLANSITNNSTKENFKIFWGNQARLFKQTNFNFLPNQVAPIYFQQKNIPIRKLKLLNNINKQLNCNKKALFLYLISKSVSENLNIKTFNLVSVTNYRKDYLLNPLDSTGLFWGFLPIHIELKDNPIEAIHILHSRLLDIDKHSPFPLSSINNYMNNKPYILGSFNYTNFHNISQINKKYSNFKIESSYSHDCFHFPVNISISEKLEFSPAKMVINTYDRNLNDKIILSFMQNIEKLHFLLTS